MNAEQLFWVVNEFIKDQLEDMSESDPVSYTHLRAHET